MRTMNLKANIHTVPFQLVKTATLSFCKVVWRRYLGKVGKFYRTSWLSYPGHCISIFIKNRSSIIEVVTKKCRCVSYASQCRYECVVGSCAERAAPVHDRHSRPAVLRLVVVQDVPL